MHAISNGARPVVAVITENTLEGIGLAGIIRTMMPHADVHVLSTLAEARASAIDYLHYFISSQTLLQHAAFFVTQPRTIVLTHGEEHLPVQGLYQLNVCLPEQELVRAILRLAHEGHRHTLQMRASDTEEPMLTPRERDVLRLLVRGHINKEVADRLGIGLTTVISHRKNLTRKLGIRSLSGLAVYAVMHGLVNVEDI